MRADLCWIVFSCAAGLDKRQGNSHPFLDHPHPPPLSTRHRERRVNPLFPQRLSRHKLPHTMSNCISNNGQYDPPPTSEGAGLADTSDHMFFGDSTNLEIDDLGTFLYAQNPLSVPSGFRIMAPPHESASQDSHWSRDLGYHSPDSFADPFAPAARLAWQHLPQHQVPASAVQDAFLATAAIRTNGPSIEWAVTSTNAHHAPSQAIPFHSVFSGPAAASNTQIFDPVMDDSTWAAAEGSFPPPGSSTRPVPMVRRIYPDCARLCTPGT